MPPLSVPIKETSLPPPSLPSHPTPPRTRTEPPPVKLASDEQNSRETVLLLYEALEARNPEMVQQLLAPNLDWHFHGPRSHQHMKSLLTGEQDMFQFLIQSVELVGTIVIAEGTDVAGDVFWVHAWTVSGGVITQLREYFNTSVTVRRLGGRCGSVWRSRIPESVGKTLPSLLLPI